MALAACPDCGKEVSTEAEKCPHCGRRTPPRTSARRVAILLGVVFVPAAIWAYLEAREYERARDRAREKFGN